MDKVPVNKVKEFETEFLFHLESKHKADVLDKLKAGEYNDDITNTLEKVCAELSGKYAL